MADMKRPNDDGLAREADEGLGATGATDAITAAYGLPADRTSFVLPAERWDAFVALLERDSRPLPGLARFLARRTMLDE